MRPTFAAIHQSFPELLQDLLRYPKVQKQEEALRLSSEKQDNQMSIPELQILLR